MLPIRGAAGRNGRSREENRAVRGHEPTFELRVRVSQNRTFPRPISWLRHFSCDSCGFFLHRFALHVPIVAMSVKVPVEPMRYVETSFEPEFVT
jgi:hypothetical protein